VPGAATTLAHAEHAEQAIGDARPETRKRAAESKTASSSSSLAFLQDTGFEAAVHVPALYRLTPQDVAGPALPVREKGAPVANSTELQSGFSHPFAGVVDLNDRRGVWQSEPVIVKALGEDPHKHHRGDDSAGRARPPAGLKNLGATCYLNSLLQYLFFNVDFRQSLLAIQCKSSVVHALQRAFALLAEGDRTTVDPSEFVTAASIDALEQADATEFSALLLDWLQRELGNGEDPGSGNFIAALFEGETLQQLACAEDSNHTFERRENFYELRARLTPSIDRSSVGAVVQTQSEDPPVLSTGRATGRGGKKGKGRAAKAPPPPPVRLEHLLEETAFPEELLNGSNQYHCPLCDCKVDARKTTRLAKLPPYLHVTIERYHYDRQKCERRKLSRPVSFPRRLELRLRAPPLQSEGSQSALQEKPDEKGLLATPPDATPGASPRTAEEMAMPVVYQCIGYLEHVSDSAHSGHYTATLLQEDKDAFEEALQQVGAQRLLSGEKDVQAHSECDASAAKRRRCGGPDAAAGAPQQCNWWTLDDTTVSPFTWEDGNVNDAGSLEAAATASCAPDRIESSAAYLVLYRRNDHQPGRLAAQADAASKSLPEKLSDYVKNSNKIFAAERERYSRYSRVVEGFLAERRHAVDKLVKVLRMESASRPQLQEGSASGLPGTCENGGTTAAMTATAEAFSLVPSEWLNDFLRGEDRCLEDLLEGDTSLAPVTYGRTLLRPKGRREGQFLDPLAVWCGEVKLLPAAALQELGGAGGLDASLFLQACEAVGTEPCRLVWDLFQAWCQEQQQIAGILKEGKLTMSDARKLEAEGRGAEAVWVSTRLQNAWRRSVSTNGPADLEVEWQKFLLEVSAARWTRRSGAAATGTSSLEDRSETTTPSGGAGVTLLGGLVCQCNMVCRPKAGFLARRQHISHLLEISAAKAQCYTELWRERRAIPRLRSGLPDDQLLSMSDVCSSCNGEGVPDHAAGATAADSGHLLLVKRRYASGQIRKQGYIKLAEGTEQARYSCVAVKAACRAAFGFIVSKLWIRGPDGLGVELADDELLPPNIDTINVEKDESVTPADREGAAFEGSIFRMAPAQTSTSTTAPTAEASAGMGEPAASS